MLSPFEFEAFVGSLFGVHENRRYARYARGADAGVDLSYTRGGRLHVIQCKLYVHSTISQLLVDLKKELPKLRKVAPASYRLVVGRRLGKKTKDDIYELFKAHLRSVDDVYGSQDLDQLLDQHPEVERRTIKLWLSSHAVLDAVLHRGTHQRTEALLQEIREALPRYVQNVAYASVRRLLRKERVCVIAGDPGVGKTMLAKILVARYRAYRYEPVLINDNISEAWDMYEPKLKQVFYYDDFLGRTNFIEKLGKNEDQDLWRLIERVAASKNKVLILTTRDYIIGQAEATYARLSALNSSRFRYLFRLPEYTRVERAQILFNHLYHSSLPTAVKRAVQQDRSYLRIVDHKYYTPRQVNEIAAAAMRSKPKASEFVDAAVRALDDPSLIWREAIETELPETHRAMVLLMATLPNEVSTDDFEIAYEAVHQSRFGRPAMETFRRALKALEGTFFRIRAASATRLVSFDKPSLTDFVVSYLNEHAAELRLLLRSAAFFEQCDLLMGYARSAGTGDARATRYRGIARALDPTELLAAIERTFGVRPSKVVTAMTSDGIVTRPLPVLPERRLFNVARFARNPRYANLRAWLRSQLLECAKGWNDANSETLEEAVDLVFEIQQSDFLQPREVSALAKRLHAAVLRGTDELDGYAAYFAYQRHWASVPKESDEVRQRFQSIAADLLAGFPNGDELDQLEYYAPLLGIDVAEQLEEERDRLRQGIADSYEPEDDDADGRVGRVSTDVSVDEDALIDAMFTKLA